VSLGPPPPPLPCAPSPLSLAGRARRRLPRRARCAAVAPGYGVKVERITEGIPPRTENYDLFSRSLTTATRATATLREAKVSNVSCLYLYALARVLGASRGGGAGIPLSISFSLVNQRGNYPLTQPPRYVSIQRDQPSTCIPDATVTNPPTPTPEGEGSALVRRGAREFEFVRRSLAERNPKLLSPADSPRSPPLPPPPTSPPRPSRAVVVAAGARSANLRRPWDNLSQAYNRKFDAVSKRGAR